MSVQQTKTRILTECALMVALATLLSFLTLYSLPQGGSITLCSMLPLLYAAHRHGVRWGILTGFVHGLLQMIFGIKNVMYCTTLPAVVGCILLDYLIAYAVNGLMPLFEKPFSSRSGILFGSICCGLLRYGCSFLSGVLIWGGYAPDGMNVWYYSLAYNGSYMIPETILTAAVCSLIFPLLSRSIHQ